MKIVGWTSSSSFLDGLEIHPTELAVRMAIFTSIVLTGRVVLDKSLTSRRRWSQ